LDSIEITTIQTGDVDKISDKEIHAHRVIARDIISGANFLAPEIKFVPGQMPEILSVGL